MKQVSKNVLCILPTINDCGGIERFYFNYYRNFSNKTHVDFITHEAKGKKYLRIAKERGSSIYVMPKFNIGNYSQIKKQYATILNSKKYDVVHCNMTNASFLYLREAKKYGVRLLINHSHQDRYASKLMHIIRNIPLVRIGNRYCNYRLACSLKAGKFLFRKQDFVVIPNAIDTKRFVFDKRKRETVRKELRVGDDSVLIGCFGRFAPEKNQLFAIKIVKNLSRSDRSNYKLLLLGDGPDKDKLVKVALQNREVLIHESVNYIEDYYSAIDLLLVTSKYEGLGMVAVEAQFANVPVIAPACLPEETNISNLIKYINPHSGVKGWATAIVKCRNRFRRLPCFNSKSTLFDLRKQADKLENIYHMESL